MEFKGISWLGVKTAKFIELCNFYENLLNLPTAHSEPGFRAYNLPNGDRIEVFADNDESHKHFSTGPVVGFLVDNIETTRVEMEAAGIEFLSPIKGKAGKSRWSHFRGPDGNVYEITER